MKAVINSVLKMRHAVFCLIIFFVIIGGYSYLTLPRENAPDITIPYVFVSTSYEGVSPEEIENLITIQLEKKFRGLDKVKEIKSESVEGSSNITIEFYPNQKLDDAVQKVKDKIDLARKDLPDDIDEPTVSEVNLSTDIPVMTIAFFGSDSPKTLKKIVEDIRDKVESVPGVLEAKIFGDLEREIRIEIDVDKLNAYGIPVSEILSIISKENKTSSAGNIDISGGKFQIRVPGEFANPNEINNLIISRGNNGAVYLTDIAVIRDTFKDISSISRINGKKCISLMVQKRSGQNVIKVTNAVKKVLQEERKSLPDGIDFLITSDLSKDTFRMLIELENNIISGMILVLCILFIVLGFRNSLFVGLAIPMSMLISFAVISFMGITLNMIVLFSLILVLGMLVDNAIVLVENSFRYRNLGYNSYEASLMGASEVGIPIIGATLTTVVAFLPLLFWPDVIGEFMWYLPVTLIITLTASLFVAMVINPVICSIWLKESSLEKAGFFKNLRAYGELLIFIYEKFLRFSVKNPKKIFSATAIIFLLITFLYFKFGAGIELFPDVEPRRARINIEYPEGTRIEKTDNLTMQIENRIKSYPEIKYFLSTIGSGGGSYFAGGQHGTNYSSILLEFSDFEERKIPSSIIV
ncbi:MAG TPA: efflux RND transporter permease subunit, partial [Victivallales bacterium]|nr:efflux RND transporter permease subunit [Victivallales bacterium]